MKKIHIITNYFYPVIGGIEKSILNTYSRLPESEFKVILHTSRDSYGEKNVYKKYETIKGIELRRYKSTWFGFWPKINWDDADIINLHNFNIFPHLLIMLFSLWRRLNFNKNFELILHPHGGYMPKWEEFKGLGASIKRLYHQSLGKWLICLAVDRVRAVSAWEAKVMKTMGAGKRFVVIPAGINDMAFEKPGLSLDDNFKKRVEGFGRYILLVGKIDRKKNHKTVIKALEKVPEDIKCIIAGKKCDENYIQELKAEIVALGLEERVLALGHVSEPEKCYLVFRSMLMVHIPENECYGLAAREAMATGALMIVSRDTGMEELKNVTSINPKSDTELAKTINVLAAISHDERQSRISQGKEEMKTNSWEAVSLRFKDLFKTQKIQSSLKLKLDKIKKTIKKYLPNIKLSAKSKQILINLFFFSFILIILFLCLRGLPGNPDIGEIGDYWTSNGPFELSPERGRYGLIYSIVENQSLQYPENVALFMAPDVSMNSDGEYVSMFAPGVSFLVLPGYVIGKYFGVAQVGAFAVILVFALINILLIRVIAIRLGAHRAAASVAGLIFVFATPAFAYAVTLYQHHVSTFIMLFSIYILMRWNNWRSLTAVWLLLGFSIIIDNPNLFLFFPIGIFALSRIVAVKKNSTGLCLKLKPIWLLTLLVMIIPISMFAWYNYESHGNPWQLSGTLIGLKEIERQEKNIDAENNLTLSTEDTDKTESLAEAVGYFETRNLLNGFYTHFVSSDRGVLWFTPVILLGVWGFVLLYRRNQTMGNLFLAIVSANVLLYSMWGDPYGGWAFGSRYLIPSYSLLAICIALLLSQYKKNIVVLTIFLLIFSHSVRVNSLGALTSNANPPKIEILALEDVTGREEKYSYDRNRQYLEEAGTKSFIYQQFLNKRISAENYYNLISAMIITLGLYLSGYLFIDARKRSKDNYLENIRCFFQTIFYKLWK